MSLKRAAPDYLAALNSSVYNVSTYSIEGHEEPPAAYGNRFMGGGPVLSPSTTSPKPLAAPSPASEAAAAAHGHEQGPGAPDPNDVRAKHSQPSSIGRSTSASAAVQSSSLQEGQPSPCPFNHISFSQCTPSEWDSGSINVVKRQEHGGGSSAAGGQAVGASSQGLLTHGSPLINRSSTGPCAVGRSSAGSKQGKALGDAVVDIATTPVGSADCCTSDTVCSSKGTEQSYTTPGLRDNNSVDGASGIATTFPPNTGLPDHQAVGGAKQAASCLPLASHSSAYWVMQAASASSSAAVLKGSQQGSGPVAVSLPPHGEFQRIMSPTRLLQGSKEFGQCSPLGRTGGPRDLSVLVPSSAPAADAGASSASMSAGKGSMVQSAGSSAAHGACHSHSAAGVSAATDASATAAGSHRIASPSMRIRGSFAKLSLRVRA